MIRALVPEPVPDEMLDVTDFAPEAVMGGAPHLPGARESFICLEGRVNLVVAGERFELAEGDVLAFSGNLAHSYQNADARAPMRGAPIAVLAKAAICASQRWRADEAAASPARYTSSACGPTLTRSKPLGSSIQF
jgi:hypothetical protein